MRWSRLPSPRPPSPSDDFHPLPDHVRKPQQRRSRSPRGSVYPSVGDTMLILRRSPRSLQPSALRFYLASPLRPRRHLNLSPHPHLHLPQSLKQSPLHHPQSPSRRSPSGRKSMRPTLRNGVCARQSSARRQRSSAPSGRPSARRSGQRARSRRAC